MKWPAADTRKLRKAWPQFVKAREIAHAVFDCRYSPESITGKARRLGLPAKQAGRAPGYRHARATRFAIAYAVRAHQATRRAAEQVPA
jgi:hypothetical protein